MKECFSTDPEVETKLKETYSDEKAQGLQLVPASYRIFCLHGSLVCGQALTGPAKTNMTGIWMDDEMYLSGVSLLQTSNEELHNMTSILRLAKLNENIDEEREVIEKHRAEYRSSRLKLKKEFSQSMKDMSKKMNSTKSVVGEIKKELTDQASSKQIEEVVEAKTTVATLESSTPSTIIEESVVVQETPSEPAEAKVELSETPVSAEEAAIIAAPVVAEEASEKPVAEEASEKPVAEDASEKPVAEEASEKPVAEDASEKPVAEDASEKPVAEEVSTVTPVSTEVVSTEEVKKEEVEEEEEEGLELDEREVELLNKLQWYRGEVQTLQSRFDSNSSELIPLREDSSELSMRIVVEFVVAMKERELRNMKSQDSGVFSMF